MKLQTPVELSPSQPKISLQSPLLLVGSCFSDEIGNLLKINKFNALVNPFGVIFNPISLLDLLISCLQNQGLPENTYDIRNGMWFNYLLHSSYYDPEIENLKLQFYWQQANVRELFSSRNTDKDKAFIVLTFGTAWVYELKHEKIIVANCHKTPETFFEKRILLVEEIVNKFEQLNKYLPSNTEIILTVSPVRHLKDTLPKNTQSKATLIVACHEIMRRYDKVRYFPAFELLTDELRDYRFYAPDMIHPSQQAVAYIFEKFCYTFIDDNTQSFIKEWEKIYNSLSHRPLRPESQEHKKFLKALLDDLQRINKIVSVKEEIEKVSKLLEDF
jgi:hypothetical protein